MKKFAFIAVSILLLASIGFLIYQNSEINKFKKDIRLSRLLAYHQLPSKQEDSLNLKNYLTTKNIKGWGQIESYDIFFIAACINTSPTINSYCGCYFSRWSGEYNYKFDPIANNNKYDEILFQVRLQKPDSPTIFVGYVKCNHLFDNNTKSWKTNFELSPEEVHTLGENDLVRVP